MTTGRVSKSKAQKRRKDWLEGSRKYRKAHGAEIDEKCRARKSYMAQRVRRSLDAAADDPESLFR